MKATLYEELDSVDRGRKRRNRKERKAGKKKREKNGALVCKVLARQHRVPDNEKGSPTFPAKERQGVAHTERNTPRREMHEAVRTASSRVSRTCRRRTDLSGIQHAPVAADLRDATVASRTIL